MVYSNIKTRSYGYALTHSPSTTCATQPATGTATAVAYQCITTGSSHIVDPVLFITYYPRAFDAERPYRFSDLLYPGISLGLSMSSPSSNYYFGISEEVLRNVQLTAGLAYAPQLASTNKFNAAPTATSSTPNIVQRFTGSWYVGVSFNILGFIQSVIGGGGSAAKSAGSTGGN